MTTGTVAALPAHLSSLAREALGQAPLIADELNHNYVGDEHVFVAIMRHVGEAPHLVLARHYMKRPEDVFDAVVAVVGKPERGTRQFDPPAARRRTEDYASLINHATSIAAERGCKQIGLVDLLLAIPRVWEGNALKVLRELGINPRELVTYAMGMK